MEQMELKELQEIIYGILVEFDRVCQKYDIQYSMEGGTLLGAVKYGDFVPWDDDIDVIMLRSEYERFLELAPRELREDYFLQSYHNVPEFPLNYAKLCYTKSEIYDYAYSPIKTMNHGVFMDIFPIDYVEPAKMHKQLRIIGLLTGARKTKLKILYGKIPVWKKLCYRIVALLPMRTLCKMMDLFCTKYNDADTGCCYEICNANKKFKPLPSSMYHDLTTVRFRDGAFSAVSQYDEFLKSRFGENYMSELPPVEKRRPSHSQNILIKR